jgi:hypothetical protein
MSRPIVRNELDLHQVEFCTIITTTRRVILRDLRRITKINIVERAMH